jgi:hypothetical protein
MSASTRRSAARLAATVLLVLLVGGCAGPGEESTTAAQATTTTATTTAPTTTTVPPMTAEELAWLKAVTTMHKKIDKVFMKEGSVYITRAVLTSYANLLRSCGRTLARIGSPSDRLKPVHALVTKACRTLDKGAKCFDKAISVSDASGGVTTANLRTFERANDCGHAAAGNGSNLLTDAETKGAVIEAQAGR